MPTATKSARRGRRRRDEDEQSISEQDVQSVTETDPSLEAGAIALRDFDPMVNEADGGLPFMDAIGMIRDLEWEGYTLYLYRLDPVVKNAPGDSKFLQFWQIAVNEEDIAREHGGGKYEFWLKKHGNRDQQIPPRVRRHKFSIDGPAKIKPGQTVAGGTALAPAPAVPVVPAQRDDSAVAELARALRDKGSNGPGVEQAMDMMGQAAKGAITIMTETVKQSQTTITGTSSGDKLLEMLMSRLDHDAKPAPAARSAVEDKLITFALDRLENPAGSAGGAGTLDELGKLKDVLGVDSIADLFNRGGGGGDSIKSIIGEGLKMLAGNLPALLQTINAMQEASFRRQLALQAAARSQPTIPMPMEPAPLTAPTTPAANQVPLSPGFQPMPAGPTVPGQAALHQPVDPAMMALRDIVDCFDSSLPGDGTASLIRTRYPEIVRGLAPMLTNRDQVMLFAKNTPPLSEIVDEEDFPKFLDDFIAEALRPEEEEQPVVR